MVQESYLHPCFYYYVFNNYLITWRLKFRRWLFLILSWFLLALTGSSKDWKVRKVDILFCACSNRLGCGFLLFNAFHPLLSLLPPILLCCLLTEAHPLWQQKKKKKPRTCFGYRVCPFLKGRFAHITIPCISYRKCANITLTNAVGLHVWLNITFFVQSMYSIFHSLPFIWYELMIAGRIGESE